MLRGLPSLVEAPVDPEKGVVEVLHAFAPLPWGIVHGVREEKGLRRLVPSGLPKPFYDADPQQVKASFQSGLQNGL